MKLDIRPVTILTRAILDTSSHWCFIGLSSSSGEVLRAERLWVLNGVVTKGAPMRGAVNAMPESATCYPCKADAPFEPLPWPVVEGEEIIEALYNVPANHTVYLPDNYDRYVCETPSGRVTVSMPLRPGYHPSPRRFIDTDGSCVPVWVWEADQ